MYGVVHDYSLPMSGLMGIPAPVLHSSRRIRRLGRSGGSWSVPSPLERQFCVWLGRAEVQNTFALFLRIDRYVLSRRSGLVNTR